MATGKIMQVGADDRQELLSTISDLLLGGLLGRQCYYGVQGILAMGQRSHHRHH